MPIKAEEIDALLPQTQCQECGYGACLPYAEAIARGEIDIARCAPGGLETLEALAKLMNVDATPYRETVLAHYRAPSVAVIDEALCIGCLKCIKACPVDAIVGSAKMMHTVLPDQCTGCELCLLPCPTDCISMMARSDAHKPLAPDMARQRYVAKNKRAQKENTAKPNKISASIAAQQDYIEAARLRVLAKKGKSNE
ncbi:MAG: RnfABCDGE type electron transport complex subunit B [Gammaproteobacteria bacterium]|nr:RnfABCDGE type electron transport complex subunit B [Gammaproteobacteria bacterium]